jgi:formylglycine-generating enzyme required for sulfatase activity
MRQIRITLLILLAGLPLLSSACQKAPEGMVRVPHGEFTMGSDDVDKEDKAAEFGIAKPWFLDEHPAHKVNLPTYYIDKYEVTYAQYRAFVDQTGHHPPPDWTNGAMPNGKDQYPVAYVTWEDAAAFCQWAGKRLPSEAEWEKAARGTDGRMYPWGNEFDESKGNFNNQEGHSVPVGGYEAGKSPYGAYDMIGNVWEWTADWYQPYPGNTWKTEKYGQKYKVLRGDSWSGLGHFSPDEERLIKAHFSHAGYRFPLNPRAYVNDAGMRCAKSAD